MCDTQAFVNLLTRAAHQTLTWTSWKQHWTFLPLEALDPSKGIFLSRFVLKIFEHFNVSLRGGRSRRRSFSNMFHGPSWQQVFSLMCCRILCISVDYIHTRMVGGCTKNVKVTSKLRASEGWHETSSVQRDHRYWAPLCRSLSPGRPGDWDLRTHDMCSTVSGTPLAAPFKDSQLSVFV